MKTFRLRLLCKYRNRCDDNSTSIDQTNTTKNNQQNGHHSLINTDLIDSSLINSNNLINNNNSLINNLDVDNNDSNQLSDDMIFESDKRPDENASMIDVEWSEEDLFIMLECCKQFIQEFTYYHISIDLAYVDTNDDEIWERIAQRVRRLTNKSYTRQQCKSRFLKLRTTYINIVAHASPENTYFGKLRYFDTLKRLVNGLKPSIDLLQLKGHLKRVKDRSKERNRDKNASSSYLALIQQVKQYSRQFSGENAVSKATVWNEISGNLNNQGFTTFTGKSCQGLFHRLRLKRNEPNKRKPRKCKSELESNIKNEEDVADEEYDEEDEDNFELDQNEDFASFENNSPSSKRVKSSYSQV